MSAGMESKMETSMEIFSYYTTKDFNLAAFLWCYKEGGQHADMEDATPSIEGAGKTVLYFKFKIPLSTEAVKKLVLRYMNGDCSVEPRAYAGAMGRLKDIIHSQRN